MFLRVFLVQLGYKVVKIGTGNFIVNLTHSSKKETSEMKKFTYQNLSAQDFSLDHKLCIEFPSTPNETLQYYDNESILIVNNYISLILFLNHLKISTSIGVDIEGDLHSNGSINLIQVASET